MTARPFVLIALLLLAGCRKGDPPAGASQGQGDMAGMDMAGMNMSGDSGVQLDRIAARRLGISFARAAERPVHQTLRFSGTLSYAEPSRTFVNARVSGWVEDLRADYVGKTVTAGEPLMSIYSPELISAQEELIAAVRLNDTSLVSAARRRLSLWNISEQDIRRVEQTGQPERTLTLSSPRSGEVVEKMVSEGQAITAGENLFLIADRRVLWVDVAVFEMDASLVKVGTPVRVRVNAAPGALYTGRVTFVQPSLNEQTRTLTARVEVPNRDGQLRPGMYATVEALFGDRATLTVPLEAVLPTGTRNIVFVNRGDGSFIPREVIVGTRGDSLIEIRQGLKPGDEVVASATYLLDSESNLAAAMQGLMLQMGMGLNMGGMTADTGKETRP